MSKSGFGERLKRDRELRGLSRDEVCAATRIGPRYLEALENEQWERLPGGVFNRGFLRAVARFLGLDEDDLLAQYDLAVNQAIKGQNSQMEACVTPPVTEKRPRAPASRAVLLVTLCGIILPGTGWLSWRWYRQQALQSATRTNPNVVMSAVTAAHRLDGNSASAPAENTGSPASTAVAASASPLGTVSQALELKVEAGKETAVSVSADGSKVFEGSMIAGQSRTFTAQDAIDISAKDAGALLLELNGQTLAPLGPPGQPGNVTLTRSDVKPTGGGAD